MDDVANHLLVFAKLPQAGANKTRLIPAIGAERVTLVYRQLVERTLSQVRQSISERVCGATMYVAGGSQAEGAAEFGGDLAYVEQVGSSLGERLQHAICTAFTSGAKRVVVIGTDCPSLRSQDLRRAFERLERHDLVIGPAVDGGYYLIGLKADHPTLFSGIDWSTSIVLEQTLQRAADLQLSVETLEKLPDVDYPEDLLPLRRSDDCPAFPFEQRTGKLSIIIPTLNEEQNLPATLASVGPPADDLELIVVDAGSADQTSSVAMQHGCQFFVGNRGRANQMNAGAAIASGEHLMFLHADTRLPAGYRNEIRRILETQAVCGAFQLAIDAQGVALRMIEWGVAFRSQLMQMPYGDQALFMRSVDFYRFNGFKKLAIMEDYELVDRLRKTGNIGLSSQAVTTSARRWTKKGALRTTLVNQLCVVAYKLGFSDKSIARLYRGRR